MSLPLIEALPGLRMYDARPLCPSTHPTVDVGRKRYVVIHESVTDPAADPVAIIKAISAYHQQYGGMGYNAIVDREGNLFYVGDWNTSRAGAAQVPWANEQSYHVCLLGRFDDAPPPLAQRIGARLICAHLDHALGRRLVVVPHCVWNVDLADPRSQWNTGCPGATWPRWLGDVMPTSAL